MLDFLPEEKCNICGFPSQDIDAHVDNEHNSKNHAKLSCEECSVTFSTKKVHSFHMTNSHPDQCHKCTECSQLFTSSTKLASHIMLKHSNNDNSEKALVCHFCSKEYSNRNSLKAQ